MNCCPSGFSYGAPVCVALSTGEPVQYKTKINSDQSITYVDSAGVESSSLPVGSSVINCNQISWVANQPASDGQELPIGSNCNGTDAVLTFDPCAMSKLDLIIEALNQAAMDNVKSVVQYQAQIESLANGQSAFYDYTMALDAAKTYTFSLAGYAAHPLVQTTTSQQDSTTIRVVVENQSGEVIPATQIIVTATSI